MNIRIIPRLDIKGPNLVKGVHLEGLRVLGKPEDFARYYYENGADEIIFHDIVASLYERNSLHHIIEKTADEIFIPLTVGGGIRTLDDIKNILRVGADKVSINTAAVKNPTFLREAVNKFGSSTIVVSIEVIKNSDGRFLVFIDNGREYTGIEVLKWMDEVQELGAGEIILTSVDFEGTGKGFDLELLNYVKSHISIPLVIHGGGGKLEHFSEAYATYPIQGFAIASTLHYNIIANQVFANKEFAEGNIDFLLKPTQGGSYDTFTIQQVKNYLTQEQIQTRR